MIDWFKGLFGRGRVKIEFEGIDKYGKIVSGDGKVPYVGLYVEDDVIAAFNREIMYHYGVATTKVKIVQHIED